MEFPVRPLERLRFERPASSYRLTNPLIIQVHVIDLLEVNALILIQSERAQLYILREKYKEFFTGKLTVWTMLNNCPILMYLLNRIVC